MNPVSFGAGPLGIAADFNTICNNVEVYADWTVAIPTVGNGVPAPGPLALLGLGVAAQGWSRRRQVAVKAAL